MMCPMCSGSGMVMTSMGPKPCPTCGGGGFLYSESDHGGDHDSNDYSYDDSGGSGGASSDYDYDSSSYDDDRNYSSVQTNKGPLGCGTILLISAGVAFLGFIVSGESGLWFGLGAFITLVVFGR